MPDLDEPTDPQLGRPSDAAEGESTPWAIGPLRRLLRGLAFVCDLVLLGGGLAWLLGRLLSDRYLWSQYLGWIPTEALAGLALGVLVAGVVLRGGRPRPAVSIVTLGVLVWLGAGEWRLHRAIMPQSEAGDADELRVLFMNISPRGKDSGLDPLFETRPDIAVLSNVHPQPVTFVKIYGVEHVDLLERFTGLVPGESPPGEAHLLRYGMFHIYSKHPIRRRASAHVGSQQTWLENDTGGSGAVLMLEIDTPGGPLIVWAVDMPSTVGASRRVMFEQARAKADAVQRVLAIDDMGRWMASDLGPLDPLREPDLVVGDFNTPAHAWSVGLLAPGTRPARGDAGFGPPGTFPATSVYQPFEIDLARIGTDLRVRRLTKVGIPSGRHIGLVLDLKQESGN